MYLRLETCKYMYNVHVNILLSIAIAIKALKTNYMGRGRG